MMPAIAAHRYKRSFESNLSQAAAGVNRTRNVCEADALAGVRMNLASLHIIGNRSRRTRQS